MNTAFLIHVFEVEIELLLIVERQKKILFGLGIFMIEAVKHLLDIRSFGISVIWTAGRNDGDLQLPAGLSDIRFKGKTEGPYKCRIGMIKIHLRIKGGDTAAVDHIHDQCLNRIIRMMGKSNFVATQFLCGLNDRTFL